ncbi:MULTISPECIES: ATP-binding protein [Chryseobacterium]|uniref:ATP-binding protein n=1 Tax=Chryseobacterium TaxID=59732 RepID=UPI00162812CB|nr:MULTISPECIES: ATP-binding protein [Chryseobacterium]MDM1556318.1 AAA family ATPase [Chryseobacterium indologenes]
MKIKSIKITNVKSFKNETKINFNNDFNIFIGPNGSGKSNLHDIITTSLRYFFLQSYYVSESQIDGNNFSKNIIKGNFEISRHLEKFTNIDTDSKILIDFIISQEEIDNINEIIKNSQNLENSLKNYLNAPQTYKYIFDVIKQWDATILNADEVLSYCIINNSLEDVHADQKKKIYLEYLNHLGLLMILINDIPDLKIKPSYIFFSPYRSSNLQTLQANLSGINYYQELHNVINVTSKDNLSLIILATIYFAEKKRSYETKANNEGYQEKWNNDNEVKLVTKYLEKLGYKWELVLKDSYKNIYEIQLEKNGQKFHVSQASSGEKEIINFLFGIFALDITNGLVIIDEPELHLHPKWQYLLLELFIDLSTNTQNQFIISTHSPVFINEKSYNHIFRIYKNENNESQETTLKDSEGFNLKEVLHIINSTNNEKIFFSDIVILVEGITDRLVFQKILDLQLQELNPSKIIEIIEIKGKTNAKTFTRFLENLKIPVFFIADLDYINEVGTQEIKNLFIINKLKIEKDVIKNPKSSDGDKLVEIIDEAIEKNNCSLITDIWDYIKSFRRKLKKDLSPHEEAQLVEFLNNQKKNNIYILKKGDIEDYLPEGYKAKNLLKVIDLLKGAEFETWKDTFEYKELIYLIDEILVESKVKSE